jgi:hypothetical protein
MKIRYIYYSLPLIFLLLSCSKDRIEPPKNQYENIQTYFDTKKQTEQEFVITKKGQSPITGAQGTKIWITKEHLQMPNGSDILYPYTVKLIALYTAKDMIYYQMPSMIEKKPTRTAGKFKITAVKDGEELSLKTDTFFYLDVVSENPNNSKIVYYGTDKSGVIYWTDNLTDFGLKRLDNSYFNAISGAYRGAIGKMGWIACDTLYSKTTGTLTFTSEVDELDNVAIFVYAPKENVLIKVYQQQSNIIPFNTDLEIIAMGIDRENKLYSQLIKTNYQTNSTVNISLQAITDEALTLVLDSL